MSVEILSKAETQAKAESVVIQETVKAAKAAPKAVDKDQEIALLKEKVLYLEHGEGIKKNADEYAMRYASYVKQIEGLSASLEKQRAHIRELEKVAKIQKSIDRKPTKRKFDLKKKAIEGVLRESNARHLEETRVDLKREIKERDEMIDNLSTVLKRLKKENEDLKNKLLSQVEANVIAAA